MKLRFVTKILYLLFPLTTAVLFTARNSVVIAVCIKLLPSNEAVVNSD